MICADTSFLFSLYGHDAHTEEAFAQLERLGRPLLLSALNEFELGNALRFAEWRGLLPAGGAAQRLEALAEDHAAGRWRGSEIPLAEIVTEAGRLSAAHTVSGGHRAFSASTPISFASPRHSVCAADGPYLDDGGIPPKSIWGPPGAKG